MSDAVEWQQPHSAFGYQRYGCRCEICIDDNYRVKRQHQLRREARLREDPSIRPHGNPSTYKNWGCRCIPCAKANYEQMLRQPNTRIRMKTAPGTPRYTPPFGREWLEDEPVH